MNNELKQRHKKYFSGLVVKKSGIKSVVVEVERRLKHSKYKKFVLRTKKYHAHDESDAVKVGQQVSIVESRPLSKLKRWVVC